MTFNPQEPSKDLIVVGIDPSWNNFGIYNGMYSFDFKDSIEKTIKLSQKDKARSYNELDNLFSFILCPFKRDALFIIEDYSFSPNSQSLTAMAELRGILELWIQKWGGSFILVAPSQVKKFATGNGRAQKDQIMLAVFKQWGYEAKNSHLADAFVLWKIGFKLWNGLEGDETKPQLEVIEHLKRKYGYDTPCIALATK